MRKNSIWAFTLIGGLLLTTACVKEKTDDEKLRPVGSEIFFSAATSYDNENGTRTIYTGKDQNDNLISFTGTNPSTIERIDWENDDRVSIVYAQQSSTGTIYKVTGIQTGDPDYEDSFADVVVASGDKLVWQGVSENVFYALYPTPSGGNHPNSAATLSGNHVTGSIPAEQTLGTATTGQADWTKYLPDMKYAYMVGYANDSNVEGNRVTLPFTPAVTAFNFIFKAQSAVTVMKFELISNNTALTGNFSFDITEGKERNNKIVGAKWGTVATPTPDASNRKITVSFGTNGRNLAANEYLDFTVFALPINQTGLSIRFTMKNDGLTYTRTIDLKDSQTSWHTFTAARKHVVTNDKLAGLTPEYVFTVTPASSSYTYQGGTKQYSVTSYKQIGSSKVEVAWEATEYSTDNGSTWKTWPTNALPSNLKRFTASGAGSTSAQAYDAVLTASPREHATNSNLSLGTKESKGTFENPYDLSYGGTSKQNTANCYVIDAPGWYCFPVVYGNAIKNGNTNTNAYDPEDHYNNNGRKYKYFLNCLVGHNGDITQPWIGTISSAALLWQDSQDLVSDISNITYNNHQYVRFYVSPATINPGNAVIAVKSSSTIVWSWHIWVTHHSMQAATIRGKQFMEVNLGWCDHNKYQNKNATRNLKIKFKQSESLPGNNPLTAIITLNQSSSNSSTAIEFYNTNPHYQWGRKDPFIPPKGLGQTGNKDVQYGPDQLTFTITQQTKSIADGIKNPTKMYALSNDGSGSNDWLASPKCNLWNYNQDQVWVQDAPNATASEPREIYNESGKRAINLSPSAHGKTVYDPCPVGYTVPTARDFQYFQTAASSAFCTKANTTSYPVPTQATNGVNMDSNFWPYMGQRAAFVTTETNFTVATSNNLNTNAMYFTSIAWLIQNCRNSLVVQVGAGTSVTMTQNAKSSARPIRCVKE